ncbi:MAG: C45 family autoproteolytic acyltransferase/hydrolase [Gemmataceae bacterium]
MPRLYLVPVLCLLHIIGLPSSSRAADDAFRFPPGKHGKGELQYINGLPVLIVAGTPEEMGEQVATLAVKPGRRVLNYPKDLLAAFGAEATWPALARVGASMVPRFPADHRAELEAMSKTGIDREQLVVGNTMFDLKKVIACSALIVEPARSATQGPLLGRNLDYDSLGYIEYYSLVTIYRPEGKRAFAAIGFPGLVGCLSGMNDAGLCLGVLEVGSVQAGHKRFDVMGTPYALCYRRLLEECATVEEAVKLLRSMKRTTITNLAICDRQGGAIFEVTPDQVVVRRPVEGIGPCTNHFCSQELKPDEQRNYFRTLERYATLDKSRQLRQLEVADVHRCLQDVSVAGYTLQSMIFEPATLRLHLSIGASPAAALPPKVLELGPLLRNDE